MKKRCKNPDCNQEFEAIANMTYCEKCRDQNHRNKKKLYNKMYREKHKDYYRAYMQEYREI